MKPTFEILLTSLLLLSLTGVLGSSAGKYPYCTLTRTHTYYDNFGPLFVEHRYTCSFPTSHRPIKAHSSSSERTWGPIRLPAPWDHPAGSQSGDPRVASRGSIISEEEDYTQQLHASQQKHQVVSYGCEYLPSPKHLPRNKYSNLFWGVSQLANQTCLMPGEMVEFVDYKRPWTADWRFTNVNRGEGEICDWYTELANIGRALHYYCYHTLGRPEDEEYSGGEEIIAFGRDSDERRGQRWCLRYSKKGWGEKLFDEECLGI
ncbi:hypothetical protein L873DRAFT_1710937 [Choiromyces venosus 120613-1]|uniref:C-type lectin domain-containing protein n=1 Tax=Choiromyces venosus 120613-1 TaxID=1336337 RepID=A0A3N4J529_9PEZI|nr:hypothetical protein L873DRAFT_1710937 [Choiromyces venosus 120613-1]